jgi:hypothetical protein
LATTRHGGTKTRGNEGDWPQAWRFGASERWPVWLVFGFGLRKERRGGKTARDEGAEGRRDEGLPGQSALRHCAGLGSFGAGAPSRCHVDAGPQTPDNGGLATLGCLGFVWRPRIAGWGVEPILSGAPPRAFRCAATRCGPRWHESPPRFGFVWRPGVCCSCPGSHWAFSVVGAHTGCGASGDQRTRGAFRALPKNVEHAFAGAAVGSGDGARGR